MRPTRRTAAAAAIAVTLLGATAFATDGAPRPGPPSDNGMSAMSVTPTPPPTTDVPTTDSTPAPSVAPPTPSTSPAPPVTTASDKVLFGIGDNLWGVYDSRLVKNHEPVKMLTSWYSEPPEASLVPQLRVKVKDAYAKGYSQHLSVWLLPNEKGTVQTKYGSACGVKYPLTPAFLDDMRATAQTYAGTGQLYVTMFFELQAYSCDESRWVGNEAYFDALQDVYLQTIDIFHRNAPRSKVALGWGGWQALGNDPATGAGKAMIPHFARSMRASDFQSFGSLGEERGRNKEQITTMVDLLRPYGGGVMIAPFGRYAGSDRTWFEEDIRWLFDDTTMQSLTSKGVFAIDLYRDDMMQNATVSTLITGAVRKDAA